MVARQRGQRGTVPVSPSDQSTKSTERTKERASTGKYRHGSALTPQAAKLLEALTRGDRRRALRHLTTLYDEGMPVSELEKNVLVPAMVKLGEMWVRGRLGDSSFKRLGSIAEQVERDFRQYIIAASGGGQTEPPSRR